LEEITPYFCRMCGTCAGQCPQGLPVADMVRFVMYADGYGQFPLGREHFQRMSAEHQAVRCDQCPTCLVKCPHGVTVAERMMRAQELFA
jgi:predicted aldo/keto reductase-like oxidoreductase